MAIRRREIRTVVVLYLKGRYYGDDETDDLEEAIMGEAAKGNQRLILNMQECEVLTSVPIGVIMRGYANYRGRGGDIKLCGLGKRLHDLFTMVKLINVFEHYETEPEALAAFAEKVPQP